MALPLSRNLLSLDREKTFLRRSFYITNPASKLRVQCRCWDVWMGEWLEGANNLD